MSETSLKTNIFRQNAINNINSLDEIQNALKIINSAGWVWLLVSILALIGILVWGIKGTITLNIETQGIIFPTERLSESESIINQNINDHDEKIAVLEDLYKKKKKLFEKQYLTQVDLLKAKEEFIAAKEELSNPNKNAYLKSSKLSSYAVVNSANTSLDALIFIDHAQGKKISQGMNAYILPNTFSAYDYGYIHGRVVSVSEYPISKQLAYSYLGNMNLVDDFFINGAPYIAKIRLQRSSDTNSGLAWTTRYGAPFSIQPGTIVLAKVTYKKCSPIKFLSKYHDCR